MFIKFIKDKVWFWKATYKVHDDDKNTLFEKTETTLWLWANYTIIFLIIVSIIIVWIDTTPWLSEKYLFEIFIADFIISTVFLIEYVYRWSRSDQKKLFPFSIINILDLLSFLPFFILICIYWMWTYTIYALFRILRVFRIFELVERIPIVRKILKWINKHKVEYLSAIFIIFIVLTIFSTLVFLSEQRWWNAVAFSSIPETFWWAVVTMSTTWYGNIIPMSILWKIMASFLMILGPILIAILSSITIIIFIDSTRIINLYKWNKTCSKCKIDNEHDAKYCRKCWTKI